MGLHRPGLKRGLSRRQSAAMQDRWDREDAKREIARLQAVIDSRGKRVKP